MLFSAELECVFFLIHCVMFWEFRKKGRKKQDLRIDRVGDRMVQVVPPYQFSSNPPQIILGVKTVCHRCSRNTHS